MNNKISNRLSLFSLSKTQQLFKASAVCGVVLSGLLGISAVTHAQAPLMPAGDRVLTGGFVDMDWSDTNPCGDKITEVREWNDNKQWYGNVNPYFGKIFPEMFRPDGSKNWYANWQNEITKIKAQGRVPYINMEFHGELQKHDNNECWHGGGKGNDRVGHNIIKEILDGKHNDLIDNVAWGLKGEKVPVLIDLFHEANGAWYDWSPCKNGESWARFRGAYMHVVNRFRAVGATNVKFGSSVWPNSDCWTDLDPWGKPANARGAVVADMYVPGYMDWIGIDIYGGEGEGSKFTSILNPWYAGLAATGRPIVVGEMSVAPFSGKEQWMRDFTAALTSGKYPALRAFNWFDINKAVENVNWRIEAGGTGPAFDVMMSDPKLVGSFGTFEVKNKANNQCLDITGAATGDFAKVQTYACNGSAAQTFTFTDLGNYKMELRALNSNKCVDVSAGSTVDGALIQQYSCNATNAQIWEVRVINWSTMEVELKAANSNKCLDVDNGIGPKVQQWWCTSGAAQRFYLNRR